MSELNRRRFLVLTAVLDALVFRSIPQAGASVGSQGTL